MTVVAISGKEKPSDLKINLMLDEQANAKIVMEKLDSLKEKIDSFSKTNRSKKPKHTAEKSPKMDESISNYFTYILEGLLTCDKANSREKSMDYFLMKPFLITALNHFKSLDGSFEDEKIKEAKWKMDKASDLWRIMIKKTSGSIESLYEEVFLTKQVEYLVLLEEHLNLADLMVKKRSDLDTTNRQLESAKESAKHSKGEEREQKIQLTKKLNARSVDLVHLLAKSRERQTEIRDLMDRFYNAHIDEFTEKFRDSVQSIRAELSVVLGLMAFRLDKVIWQKAKSSNSIKNFFYESRIHGFFSSKTFLEYFIKNIDKDKASSAQKALAKYLDDYNKKNKINIALVAKNEASVLFLKHQIERIDNMVNVKIFNNISVVLSKHKSDPFHAIISSYNLLSNYTALDLIARFRESFLAEKDQIFIIIRDENLSSCEIELIRNIGVRNFIDANISQDKLTSKLIELL